MGYTAKKCDSCRLVSFLLSSFPLLLFFLLVLFSFLLLVARAAAAAVTPEAEDFMRKEKNSSSRSLYKKTTYTLVLCNSEITEVTRLFICRLVCPSEVLSSLEERIDWNRSGRCWQ